MHINANKGLATKTLDMLALYFLAFILALASTHCLYLIYNPWASSLAGNLFPETTSWLLLQLVNFPEILATFVCYLNLCVPMEFYFYSGTVLVPMVVREFRLGLSENRYMADASFRQPENFTMAYRAIQIGLMMANQLCGKFLVPAQAFVSLLFIFCNYVLIRHGDLLSGAGRAFMTVWVVATPLGWLLILMLGGYLHSNGQKILKSWKTFKWKSRREAELMKRFARSCQPVKICFGSVYVIKRVSAMVFTRGLVRGLMRALLTLETQ